jgi:uncharacterized protein YpmS
MSITNQLSHYKFNFSSPGQNLEIVIDSDRENKIAKVYTQIETLLAIRNVHLNESEAEASQRLAVDYHINLRNENINYHNEIKAISYNSAFDLYNILIDLEI